MNMREKIARAIARGEPYEWQAYLPKADAALEAMKEPTDEMISKACKNFDGSTRHFYTAMIDAAREGK